MKRIDDFLKLLPDIKDTSFYVWGTGNTAQLYQEGIAREDRIDIKGYIDNNQQKWGEDFAGKKVFSPKQYQEKNDAPVLICTSQKNVLDSVKEQISSFGGQCYNFDDIIFSWHKDELCQVYESLFDEKSKDIFLQVLLHRLTWNQMREEYVSDKQYFAVKDFCIRKNNDVFVDCGAFVGDSLEQYIWQMDGVYQKIIAFELDPGNFKALERRTERLKAEWNVPFEKIEIYPHGVGDMEKDILVRRYADNNGLGSKISTNDKTNADDDSVKMVSLDGFFANREEVVTFLKADIESFEYKMLLGAERLIKEQKPRIAVCIYHNSTDIYSIPLLLKKYNPDYKFSIRHHSYNLDETVLYAHL